MIISSANFYFDIMNHDTPTVLRFSTSQISQKRRDKFDKKTFEIYNLGNYSEPRQFSQNTSIMLA
jgi:hypothetical protein